MAQPRVARRVRLTPLLLLLLSLSPATSSQAGVTHAPHGRIVWDTYGVPHIFAKNAEGVFYGFGYAQAQAHGDLLLHLYGESRGRAAEYWGAEFEASDRYLLANDAWKRAKSWYAQQSPQMRGYLDAFAAGINAYAAEHPERIAAAVRVVLPVQGLDVMAHWEHVMEFLYLAPPSKVFGGRGLFAHEHEHEHADDPQEREGFGSNAWAIAPRKTVDGHAMLLSNPHLAWAPSFMIYLEAELSAPGIEMYGATQVGFPVLRFCFNHDHGLTNTINPITAATVYGLTLSHEGYRYDGRSMRFETAVGTLKVKQPNGKLKSERVELRRSVHGPVFQRNDGSTVALRVAALDRPFGIQEYWDLNRAHGLEEFTTVLQRLQVPMFNMIYADKDGHILYQYNGTVPVHAHGDFAYWSGLVPGDRSDTLWTAIHPYADLPRTLDPPAGWVQNTNNPPWLNTAPPAVQPNTFPAYFAPVSMSLRTEQSELLLGGAPQVTVEEFAKLKMTTRSLLADRVLGPLLAAAADNDNPLVQSAVTLLQGWDHRFDNDSRAALLFETWAGLFAGPKFQGTDNFSVPWSLNDPLATPDGLKNPAAAVAMLEAAARTTIATYGRLDRPFGEVSRFHLGDVDLPGNGGFGNLGIFRVMSWSPLENGERTPMLGDTYVSVVEFSTPLKAMGLLSYGESTQAGSKHRGDQLELLSRQQLRPLWLTLAETLEHAEAEKRF